MDLRRAELWAGVVLAALGALSLVEAGRLRDDWQGARLLPGVVGVVLMTLALGHLVAAPAGAAAAWPDARSRRRVGLLVAVLVVYVVALPLAGFAPATAVFVLVLLRALGGYAWTRTVVLAALVAGACELVFRHWLGMPLP